MGICQYPATYYLVTRTGKNVFEGPADLSGNIGVDSRELLLQELAELDHERSRIAHKQGRMMLQSSQEYLRDWGVKEVETMQRHGQLVETAQELSPQIRIMIMGKKGNPHFKIMT